MSLSPTALGDFETHKDPKVGVGALFAAPTVPLKHLLMDRGFHFPSLPIPGMVTCLRGDVSSSVTCQSELQSVWLPLSPLSSCLDSP